MHLTLSCTLEVQYFGSDWFSFHPREQEWMTDGAASIYIVCMCVYVRLCLWSCVWFPVSPGEVNKVVLKEMIPLMPLSIPYTLYLYLCAPECVFSCTAHLSIFTCACTVLPFVCRRLVHVTGLPFWSLPLSLYPSLFPLPTSSPYVVSSSCSTYMCPAAYWHWTECVWTQKLRDSGDSMNSRLRWTVGGLWVIQRNSCAQITAVCLKSLHVS